MPTPSSDKPASKYRPRGPYLLLEDLGSTKALLVKAAALAGRPVVPWAISVLTRAAQEILRANGKTPPTA